jgi:hypothetical protein
MLIAHRGTGYVLRIRDWRNGEFVGFKPSHEATQHRMPSRTKARRETQRSLCLVSELLRYRAQQRQQRCRRTRS